MAGKSAGRREAGSVDVKGKASERYRRLKKDSECRCKIIQKKIKIMIYRSKDGG